MQLLSIKSRFKKSSFSTLSRVQDEKVGRQPSYLRYFQHRNIAAVHRQVRQICMAHRVKCSVNSISRGVKPREIFFFVLYFTGGGGVRNSAGDTKTIQCTLPLLSAAAASSSRDYISPNFDTVSTGFSVTTTILSRVALTSRNFRYFRGFVNYWTFI